MEDVRAAVALLLLATLMFSEVEGASTSPVLSYNRLLVAHERRIAMTQWVTGPRTYTYAAVFDDTINVALGVAYTTQSMEAKLMANVVGGSIRLDYQINKRSLNTTVLETDIYGYFEKKYFQRFTFRFLLVQPISWRGSHFRLFAPSFTSAATHYTIPLPSSSVPGNSFTAAVMLRDMQVEFDQSAFTAGGSLLELSWTAAFSSVFTMDLVTSGYFTSWSVQFLVVMLDETALRADQAQYQFKTECWQSGSTSTSNSIPLDYDSEFANYIFGLSSVKLHMGSSDPSFSFDLARSSSYSVQQSFRGSDASDLDFTYCYAFFAFYACNSTYYPVFNTTDRLCYDQCAPGQYLDGDRLCQPCRFDCQTCANTSSCKTCNTTNRYLDDAFACQPLDGFYESGVYLPIACDPLCRTCSGSPSSCTSCAASSYLAGSDCLACSSLFEGCASCNSSYCFSCAASYSLVSPTYCNLACADADCGVCSNSDTSVCLLCNSLTVKLNSAGKCVAACGDGIVYRTEECDDGNEVRHDGCYGCMAEPDYKCYNRTLSNGQQATKYCAYTRAIDFTVLSVEKIDYANQISIIISVHQYRESFWRTRAVLDYCFVEATVPFRNMRVAFLSPQTNSTVRLGSLLIDGYPPASLMRITFEYLSSIHGLNVALAFNFTNATDLALTDIPPIAVSVPILPVNNLDAHLYTQDTYSNERMLSNYFFFLSIVGLAMLLLSFVIGGKRIAVEMLTVFQVGFVSLVSAPIITPLLSSVTSLAVAGNGYNLLKAEMRPIEDTLSDERVKGMLLYSQFLYNFNTGALLIVLPLMVGVVVFVVSKIGERSEVALKRIQRIYRLALGEFTFIGLMFAGSMVGCGAVIELRFGMGETGSMVGLLSVVAVGVLLVLYPIYVLVRARWAECFQEYGETANDRVAVGFQCVWLVLGLLVSAVLTALCRLSGVNWVAAGLPLLLFLFTLPRPLFRKQLDHYRTQLNLLTLALLQAPFLYANQSSVGEYSSQGDLSVGVALTLGVLLGLNLAGNLSLFVYVAVRKAGGGQGGQEAVPREEESLRNEQIEEIYKNSLINPLNCINQAKFVDGFIEYSEKDLDEQPYYKKLTINPTGMPSDYPDAHGVPGMHAKAAVLENDYIHSQFRDIDEL